MVTNNRIAELIRENKPEYIPEAIAEGSLFDMQTLSAALIDRVLAGDVDDHQQIEGPQGAGAPLQKLTAVDATNGTAKAKYADYLETAIENEVGNL